MDYKYVAARAARGVEDLEHKFEEFTKNSNGCKDELKEIANGLRDLVLAIRGYFLAYNIFAVKLEVGMICRSEKGRFSKVKKVTPFEKQRIYSKRQIEHLSNMSLDMKIRSDPEKEYAYVEVEFEDSCVNKYHPYTTISVYDRIDND